MKLETWVLVLVMTVEVHVHPSIEEPTIWQTRPLDLSLDRFHFFWFKVFNLSQSLFLPQRPSAVS